MSFNKLHLIAAAVIASVSCGAMSAHASIIPGNYPDVLNSKEQATYTTGPTNHLTITSASTTSVYTLKPASDSTTWLVSAGAFGKMIFNADVTDTGGVPTFSNVTLSVGDTNTGTTFFASSHVVGFSFTPLANPSTTTENLTWFFSVDSGTQATGTEIELQFHSKLNSANVNDLFAQGFDNTTGNLFLSTTSDTSAVPEPASLSLLGLAIPALLRRRRRA